MRAYGVAFVCVALAAAVLAEAPLPGGNGGWGGNGGGGNGGYSNGGGGNGGGYSNGGGLSGGGGSGPLLQKPTGPQTMEGLMVDPQLLEQVKMVLLQHESESASANGGSNGGASTSYGPPRNTDRIVGLMLEQPVQSIQLAEYWQGDQQQQQPPSGSYGPPRR
ncbi:serine, glycine, tyrosine and glutamine-rich protein-like [Anopheles maculipalpis]|uniref:serine, glycine, tyrosine and glutamine-rich protein-like n=1 Tax=Anopheles maculipalpis TaxID=1496333 RepID=UPI002158E5B8|nr:serine, glycine, tyrosine and glutamine-rich protein-like [Anopheles maculipalpis]